MLAMGLTSSEWVIAVDGFYWQGCDDDYIVHFIGSSHLKSKLTVVIK